MAAWIVTPPTEPGAYQWRWVDAGYVGPICHVRVVRFAGSVNTDSGKGTWAQSDRPENPGTLYAIYGGEWRAYEAPDGSWRPLQGTPL